MSDLVANLEDMFYLDAALVLLCVQKCTNKDRNKTFYSCAHFLSDKSNAIEIIFIHYLLNKIFTSDIIIESENHMQYAHVATVKLEYFSFYNYCA